MMMNTARSFFSDYALKRQAWIEADFAVWQPDEPGMVVSQTQMGRY